MLSLGLSSLDLSRTASLRYLASEGCDCCFELGLSLAGLLPSRCGGGWEQGLGASRWGPSCPWRWRCLGGQAAGLGTSWGSSHGKQQQHEGGTGVAGWVWKPRGTGWSSLLAPERMSRLEQLQVWSFQQPSAAHLWGWEPAELSIPLPVAICSCCQVAARITHVLCVSEELGCKSSPSFGPCDEGAQKNSVSSAGKANLHSLISHLNVFGI